MQPSKKKLESPTDKSRVAVTGASGLVGSNLVQFLVKRQYPVLALIRSKDPPDYLSRIAKESPDFLTIKTADVIDYKTLRSVLSDRDITVHAAGDVDPFGSRQEIFRTNVDGTRTLLTASKDCGVKHFIHISSLSVITGQGDQFNLDESAPLKYCGENYADSKVEAEKLVMSEANSNTIKVTAIRPGFIYGPRERTWMPRLIESIRLGKAALIDGGKKETNVVYVNNLCQAIEAAMLCPAAFGQVFNITDGEKITKKDLFDAIADGLGLPRVERRIPGFVAQAFCQIVSSIAANLNTNQQRKLARYSRAAFRLAAVNQGFSIAKAERLLNYKERISFAQGMSETLPYFRSENSLAGNDAKELVHEGLKK
jgi:nucleoside-diphosphate-sugar epimerase